MTFKLFQDSGMISKTEVLSDTSRLHRDTTDVIIYLGRYYIEMLKNGKFLYRPKGTGQGKRSKFLHIVEQFMYNQINEDGRFN
ncbi:MAG: hypothetical protein Tp158DCM1228761_20 [Prokaryotic dsDNA virus sp.]|nr:MAG: hypothetical protein Tp158DCM1228761_20 [Prokaryotic dsDNA virus sp.]|tara:strand:- start:17413 stop:17661 length:249 start_codon:yes stop_codon:yes gene_type:complete